MIKPVRTAAAFVFALIALPVSAADYPAPKEGAWVARAFRFHTGDVIPELRLHYTTVGEPTGTPVLILHGTGGAGAREQSMAKQAGIDGKIPLF